MSSLRKIFEIREAHEEVRFAPYLSQENTAEIKNFPTTFIKSRP
jgi:hypothetical protein